jgi:hypothetical protein
MLLTYASQHIQSRQKALTLMNIKLRHVVSEIRLDTGVAGREAFHILARARSTPPGLRGQGILARHEAVC